MNKKFDKSTHLWVLKPTKEDLQKAAYYSKVSLPFTFNRMGYTSTPNSMKRRATHIASGILAQEMLRREMKKLGANFETEVKSHRADDLFDFKFMLSDKEHRLDLKTFNYFSDYKIASRLQFEPSILEKYKDYGGPDWRKFFPMLIPHTQIAQEKNIYAFAISKSPNLMGEKKITSESVLVAYAYGDMLPYLSSKKIVLARESKKAGFKINISYDSEDLLSGGLFNVKINGEMNGKLKSVSLDFTKKNKSFDVGPFSCFTSIEFDPKTFINFQGKLTVKVISSDFQEQILNTAKENINKLPKDKLFFTRENVADLYLPEDFELYVIGWISKEEYLIKCRNYLGWVWPNDKVNKFENQAWSQITEADLIKITKHGFADCIQRKPSLLKAGWLKTTGQNSGACCYVFPNIGRFGGVKETNLYILPKDLNIMNSLIEYLKSF